MKPAGSLPLFTSKELDGHPLPRRRRPAVCCSAASSDLPYSPIHPSSAVPFSWERTPGVPKSLVGDSRPNPDPLHLPLPPSLMPSTRSGGSPKNRPSSTNGQAAAGRRRRVGIADRLGVVAGMYGSCKTACSVAESTVCIPRASLRSGSYGLLDLRRPG